MDIAENINRMTEFNQTIKEFKDAIDVVVRDKELNELLDNQILHLKDFIDKVMIFYSYDYEELPEIEVYEEVNNHVRLGIKMIEESINTLKEYNEETTIRVLKKKRYINKLEGLLNTLNELVNDTVEYPKKHLRRINKRVKKAKKDNQFIDYNTFIEQNK